MEKSRNPKNKKILLLIDGIVNLLLGAILLLFPIGLQKYLGLPPVTHYFYTTILGGVLIGIGLALFIEAFWGDRKIRGLGLAGAIAINLCGGGVLVVWLLAKPFDLSLRGLFILWVVAILVMGIGCIELLTKSWSE